MAFESDNPQYAFTEVTDSDGCFAHGSKAKAGGAPAGSYQGKIVASPDNTGLSTSVPAKYDSYDTSDLRFLCEPKQNHWDIQLSNP